MRNIADSACKENQNTISFATTIFSAYLAVYEIMLKSMVKPDRPQMIRRRMCFAYWITEGTNTHSEYVKLTAFPRQQMIHKSATMIIIIIIIINPTRT